MTFWDLNQDPESPALIDHDGRLHSYAAVKDAADRVARQLDNDASRGVGFILFDAYVEAVVTYLAALRSGSQAQLLLQPNINPILIERLVAAYRPDWIAAAASWSAPGGYQRRHIIDDYALYFHAAPKIGSLPHPDCGLLLSTSGSTGSPRLVRLSYAALAHNAESIAQYLGLSPDDRAITTLPPAYSFGMSILNSHLAAGASVVLTRHNLLTRDFWTTAAAQKITSLSGVPSTFEMMVRAGIDKRDLPSLRMLTQAGGRLRDELIRHFAGLARDKGWSFFVMYGQTEAAPRISYVPPDRLLEKIGSIGIPIPGGFLAIDPEAGELIYRGPNVMMGYAQSREDLAKSDEYAGTLRTGDLARQDDEGFFYLTGRLARFVKLSGNRVNMDEVEQPLARELGVPVACVGRDDRLVVFVGTCADLDKQQVQKILREVFNIDLGLVQLEPISQLPLMANGKLDYRALEGKAGLAEVS